MLVGRWSHTSVWRWTSQLLSSNHGSHVWPWNTVTVQQQVFCDHESWFYCGKRPCFLLTFKGFISFHVCECFPCMYVCASRVCLIAVEVRRGYQIPGTGLIGGCEPWVLETKFRSPGRAVNTLNHFLLNWNISITGKNFKPIVRLYGSLPKCVKYRIAWLKQAVEGDANKNKDIKLSQKWAWGKTPCCLALPQPSLTPLIEPRALHMLGRFCTSEVQPKPSNPSTVWLAGIYL